MMTTNIVICLVILALIAVIGFLAYLYIREKTLDEIRADIYQLFLRAEQIYLSGEGLQKMEFVIQRARSMLPLWAKFFITEDLLRRVVQLWFDAVKDLLDDGKYNRSTGKNTEVTENQ